MVVVFKMADRFFFFTFFRHYVADRGLHRRSEVKQNLVRISFLTALSDVKLILFIFTMSHRTGSFLKTATVTPPSFTHPRSDGSHMSTGCELRLSHPFGLFLF